MNFFSGSQGSEGSRFTLGLSTIPQGGLFAETPAEVGTAFGEVFLEAATAATQSLAVGARDHVKQFIKGMREAISDLDTYLGGERNLQTALSAEDFKRVKEIEREILKLTETIETKNFRNQVPLMQRKDELKKEQDSIIRSKAKFPLSLEIRERLSDILDLIKSSEIKLTSLGISQEQIDFVKRHFNDEGKPISLFVLIMLKGLFNFLINQADVLRVLIIEQSVKAYPHLKAALTEVALKGEQAIQTAVNKLQNISNNMEERFRIIRILLLKQENLTEKNLQKLFNNPKVLNQLLMVKNANIQNFEKELKKHLKNMYINNNKVNQLTLKPEVKEKIMLLLTAYEASRHEGKRQQPNGNGNEYNINGAMREAKRARRPTMTYR